MKRGFKSEAERKSLRFRKDMNLKYSDKMCGFALADFLGIPVKIPSDILGFEPNHLNNLLYNNKSEFSAVVIPSIVDGYWIIHNSAHSEKRQQSNICHELAHIICEHEFSPFGVVKDFPLPLRNYNKEHEDEANYLGGCLQIPRKALIWAFDKGMTKEEISRYYNASIQMVQYRINLTGLSKTYKKLFG